MAHVRRDRADRADPEGQLLKPRLVLLTTGGTIASAASDRATTIGYELSHVAAPDALLHAVPELCDLAEVDLMPLCQMSSADVTMASMHGLARRVAAILARDDVNGLVITHGTDTMEETAWFLHLTVRSTKPIVLTGAMRPGTALGADGPMNLLAAATVAASPHAVGQGAMLVLNNRIHSARLARKAHTTAPDAFVGGEIGTAVPGEVRFLARVEGRHTATSAFAAEHLPEPPLVILLPAYADMPPALLKAARDAGSCGLVLACTGNGSIPARLLREIEALAAADLPIVRSSRTLGGAVTWEGLPGLRAGVHTPQKARILLSLALTQTRSPSELQDVFDQY